MTGVRIDSDTVLPAVNVWLPTADDLDDTAALLTRAAALDMGELSVAHQQAVQRAGGALGVAAAAALQLHRSSQSCMDAFRTGDEAGAQIFKRLDLPKLSDH